MRADIAKFAAVAQDHHRAARAGRAAGDLNAQVCGVVKRGLPAISQAVDGAQQPVAIGRIVHDEDRFAAEGDDGDRVLRAQGAHIARGRLFGFSYGAVSHAAAGINDQDAGECQVVIGDVLHSGNARQASQFAADREIADAQARNKLTAAVEDAGVDVHLGQVGRVDADDIQRDAGAVLARDQGKWQRNQQDERQPANSLHVLYSQMSAYLREAICKPSHFAWLCRQSAQNMRIID